MAQTVILINHERAGDYKGKESMKPRTVVGHIINFLSGCVSGAFGATTMRVGLTTASGNVTLDNASGTLIVYIAGYEMPGVEAAGGDAATAEAIAAVINDPSNGVTVAVTAVAEGPVVTITANFPSALGNFFALGANGTGIQASDTTLLGGSTAVYTF